ncbi:hypothetical protein [Paenibacillus sp. YN15]|uniref:hypothetical protein n=1 Tax=Paenibacillus sp. YN15 TaxID=1742774 RepID=UPI000DCE76C4|nr:hypothetical protein [Paenibacillus sp. YN15]RAU96795.1 hypothetical protein DQG13_19755 [Paenibacillus sp. YN15]
MTSIRTNRDGDRLFDKFQVLSGKKTDPMLPAQLRTTGLDILRESPFPAFGFTKAGVNLGDRKQVFIPASCSSPAVRLHGSAITKGKLHEVNLQTFDSMIEVVHEKLVHQPKLPEALKRLLGPSWETRLNDSISEQQLKNKFYQMLIAGIGMSDSEVMVSSFALVQYITSRPQGHQLNKFLAESGIDKTKQKEVYQAWVSGGLGNFIRESYALNPWFNPTNTKVMDIYNEHVRRNGKGDLSMFGVVKDVVSDAQEFSSFGNRDSILSAMETFLGRMKGDSEPARIIAPDNGLRVAKLSESRAGSGRTQSADEKELRRIISVYARAEDIPYSSAIRQFEERYMTVHRVNIRQKAAQMSRDNGFEQINTVDYLARTGNLDRGINVARGLGRSSIVI